MNGSLSEKPFASGAPVAGVGAAAICLRGAWGDLVKKTNVLPLLANVDHHYVADFLRF